jgi:CheY-like chemotaxis protein
MTMPGLDGVEAFREMRQVRRDLRAVLMSGFTEQTVRARAVEQGIAGFVQKPFRQDQLAREIRRVLER